MEAKSLDNVIESTNYGISVCIFCLTMPTSQKIYEEYHFFLFTGVTARDLMNFFESDVISQAHELTECFGRNPPIITVCSVGTCV